MPMVTAMPMPMVTAMSEGSVRREIDNCTSKQWGLITTAQLNAICDREIAGSSPSRFFAGGGSTAPYLDTYALPPYLTRGGGGSGSGPGFIHKKPAISSENSWRINAQAIWLNITPHMTPEERAADPKRYGILDAQSTLILLGCDLSEHGSSGAGVGVGVGVGVGDADGPRSFNRDDITQKWPINFIETGTVPSRHTMIARKLPIMRPAFALAQLGFNNEENGTFRQAKRWCELAASVLDNELCHALSLKDAIKEVDVTNKLAAAYSATLASTL